MQCPECSAESPDLDRFCRSCGSPMRGESATATAAAVAAETPTATLEAPTASVAARPAGKRPAVERPAAAAAARDADDAAAEAERAASRRSPATASSSIGPTPTPDATTPSAPPPAATPEPQRFLLPSFPCRLVWSPRKCWEVDTALSAADVAGLFEGKLTEGPKLLRALNSYHRRVRWNVQRNAISGQVVATCQPTGLIPVGFGRNKVHVDVTGDTVVLDTEPASSGRTRAAVGVGRYTTWLGLYVFPATHLPRDVVKAIKKADPTARVTYPWSIVRMLLLALLAITLLVGAAGGGDSGATASSAAPQGAFTSNISTPGSNAPGGDPGGDAPPANEDPDPADGTETPVTDDGNTATVLPGVPRAEMRRDIQDLLRTWHEDVVSGDERAAWDLLTERKQRQSERKYGYAEWARNQRTLAPYLDPSGARVSIDEVDDRTGVVTVHVRGMTWSKPGARCASWSGVTWVRYEDGAWRYDPGYSTTPQRERRWKDRFDELLGGAC